MERKLLITVGDDPNFLYGVRFVSSFFKNKGDMSLTLLNVAPRFESMDTKESLRMHEIDLILSEIYSKKGQQALEAAEQILRHQDFSGGRVTAKLIQKHYGMVRDILDEARLGNFHAIVLGRRGYSVFEKILHTRLPEDVLDLEVEFPLWVCRRPERGLKDVLLCVDGSQSSLRAAEHVGLMAGKEDQHRITLLHVDDGRGSDADVALGAAKLKLLVQDIANERIRIVRVEATDVAGAIREEADAGAYAVVALGRRGIKNEAASEKQFMGSKCYELLEMLERTALWVSH